jgi:hypothetical protein
MLADDFQNSLMQSAGGTRFCLTLSALGSGQIPLGSRKRRFNESDGRDRLNGSSKNNCASKQLR